MVCIIRLAGFLRNLFRSGQCLLRGQFLTLIGRTVFAKASTSIPANFGAHLFSATGTLMKLRPGFQNGLLQGFVVGFAANGPLYLPGNIADFAEKTTKDATGSAK